MPGLRVSDYLTKPFDFLRCFYASMGIETVDLMEVQQEYRMIPLRLRRDRMGHHGGDPAVLPPRG